MPKETNVSPQERRARTVEERRRAKIRTYGEKRESSFSKKDKEVTAAELQKYWGLEDKSNAYYAIEKAKIETIYPRAENTRHVYWLYESTLAYIKWQRSKYATHTKDPKNVNKEERISQLDQRRIRQIDIKNAILERQWAPIEAMEVAISRHNQNWRNTGMAIMPRLRRKYPDAPIEMLEDINQEIVSMINKNCELELSQDDFE